MTHPKSCKPFWNHFLSFSGLLVSMALTLWGPLTAATAQTIEELRREVAHLDNLMDDIPNRLNNPSFEYGFSGGWEKRCDRTVQLSGDASSPARSGNRFIRAEKGSFSGQPSIYQDVSGIPSGADVLLFGWVRSRHGGEVTMALWELGGGVRRNETSVLQLTDRWQIVRVLYSNKRRNDSTLRVEVYFSGPEIEVDSLFMVSKPQFPQTFTKSDIVDKDSDQIVTATVTVFANGSVQVVRKYVNHNCCDGFTAKTDVTLTSNGKLIATWSGTNGIGALSSDRRLVNDDIHFSEKIVKLAEIGVDIAISHCAQCRPSNTLQKAEETLRGIERVMGAANDVITRTIEITDNLGTLYTRLAGVSP